MTTNGRTGFAALLLLLDNPLGKFVAAAVLWAVTFAYVAGAARADITNLTQRLDRIEAKVDSLVFSAHISPATTQP